LKLQLPSRLEGTILLPFALDLDGAAIFGFPMFVSLPYRVLPHCANIKMPAPLPA